MLSKSGRSPAALVAFVATVLAVSGVVIAVLFALAPPDRREPSSAAPAQATPPAPAEPADTDEQVCGDLERIGERFYVDMYEPFMTSGTFPQSEMAAEESGTVAAVVGALSMVGAPEGEIDGSEAISQASQPVSEALARMTGDADRSAQRIVDSGLSGMVSGYDLGGVDLTQLVTSFTDSLIACTDAGYQPSYFDPYGLTGQ